MPAIYTETKKSDKLTIKHTSNTADNNNEILNVSFTAQELANDSILAGGVDSFAKSLVNLSTDTYDDSIIKSVNSVERIARGE